MSEVMKNIEYYKKAAELLSYDGDSGELRWLVSRGRKKAGELARNISSKGYMRVGITVNGKAKQLTSHRVAWFIFYKKLPGEIDHIDNNRMNNSIKNLRECTHQCNMRNMSPNRNTSSKYKGVTWSKNAKKWQSNIGVNGKRIHLGLFTDEVMAAIAYNDAAKKHFGDFSNLNLVD